MSLRPRYSLLTLLVVTALVAGGVKWWRGPQQASVNLYTDLSRSFQNPTQLAALDPLLYKLLMPCLLSGTERIDYEYLRTLSGENQLQGASFCYGSQYHMDLLLGKMQQEGHEFYVHQLGSEDKSWDHAVDGQRALECAVDCVIHGIIRVERLVCWATNDEADFTELRTSRAVASEFGSYTEAAFPFPKRPGRFAIYLLTTEGHLYQVIRPPYQRQEESFCVVRRVSLSEVSPPLRNMLGDELQRMALTH